MAQDKRDFTAPPGGVMTDEVGAITGDLSTWLDPEETGAVRVSYAGALDTYTVTGSPVADLTIDQVVERLSKDPGPDETGNPGSADLR
ncbi:hypothetical protein HJ588_12880 [Flexivirga sp. ID2601S]|uniref:Uncharacterized protein n=1 Tax=Flexivirga aerilata TaxID=1656889 RepID=A0A849AIE6_9MICO|nr:hypothetical protein [Flexivirga aerilata]NNG40159.1 hypothetical protein [Flexivirga aerilata]